MGVGQNIRVWHSSGMDPYGKEMKDAFCQSRSMLRICLCSQIIGIPTCTPSHMWGMSNQHRMDFGNFNHLDPRIGTQVLSTSQRNYRILISLLLTQQVMSGIHTTQFRKELTSSFRSTMTRHSSSTPGTMLMTTVERFANSMCVRPRASAA